MGTKAIRKLSEILRVYGSLSIYNPKSAQLLWQPLDTKSNDNTNGKALS